MRTHRALLKTPGAGDGGPSSAPLRENIAAGCPAAGSARGLGAAGYRLYPFSVSRLSGQPFDSLAALNGPDACASQSRLAAAEEDLERARRELSESLHKAVGEAADGRGRRHLLSAGRKLRHQGKLSAEQERSLRRAGAGVAESLEGYRAAAARRDGAREALENAHAVDLCRAREALRGLARNEVFQRGLVLASPVLWHRFQASLSAPLEQLPDNRDRRRLLFSLAKYYTRSAAKTTPFSTFAALAPVRFAAGQGDLFSLLPDAGAAQPTVTLNKALYGLLNRALRQEPDLFPCFSVTINPTLAATSGGYALLLSQDGRERIVRVPATSSLELVVAPLAERGGTLPYETFVALLAEEFDTEPVEISRRLDRLIATGVLQLNTSIPDYEQAWAPILLSRLAASPHPLARKIRRWLADIEELRKAFGQAPAAARARLLERFDERCDEVFATAGPSPTPAGGATGVDVAGDLRRSLRKNPFYEDTAFRSPVAVDHERLRDAFSKLAEWLDLMDRRATKWALHANLREHYERTYGVMPVVPFPVFYQSFYTQVFDGVVQQEKGVSGTRFEEAANPYGLAVLDRLQGATDRLCERINRLWAAAPRAEEIVLRRRHLEDPELSGLRHGGPRSAMVFVQLLARSPGFDRDALVIDKQVAQTGMGRYFSRFLHCFDRRAADELRAHNTRFPDFLVAELCDDGEFSFNANLHPPLAGHEINYPALVTGLDPRTNLAMAELDVRRDPDHRQRLKLIHRGTGREVLPVDLGFLAAVRRPPLFRVLALFSPLASHRLTIPWHNERLEPRAVGVVYRPRVLFEEHLVLSRRSWKVEAAVLRRLLGPASATFFHRLERWRSALGMPQDVFFFSHPPEARPGPAPETEHRRYTHKPQYLSFASPLLCELLGEELRGHRGSLIFEEMLPTLEMLPRLGGRPHVAELIVQFDRDP